MVSLIKQLLSRYGFTYHYSDSGPKYKNISLSQQNNSKDIRLNETRSGHQSVIIYLEGVKRLRIEGIGIWGIVAALLGFFLLIFITSITVIILYI